MAWHITLQGSKLERPKIDAGVSREEWNVFVRRWEVFQAGSGITEASAPYQLFQCAGAKLGDSLLKANPNAGSNILAELLNAMRSLAVIPVATCVLQTELLQLRQQRDEPFRTFTAKVRGKAEACAFAAECECGKRVDYTDHIIRDVLLNGLSDPDIHRKVLATPDIFKKPINDVVAFEAQPPNHRRRPNISDRSTPSQRNPRYPQQTPTQSVRVCLRVCSSSARARLSIELQKHAWKVRMFPRNYYISFIK